MKRLKRVLKIIGKIILAIVLLLLVANCVLWFYWGRQFQARVAALKAAGQPVSYADLEGPPVPDSENAAPLYEKAFKLMDERGVLTDMDAADKICYSSQGKPTPKDWASAHVTESCLTCGYSFLSLIRASAVVNCHSMVTWAALRSRSQAAILLSSVSASGIRRERHCRDKTDSSVSAILSQLPCSGV